MGRRYDAKTREFIEDQLRQRRLPLESIAHSGGVPLATVTRWAREIGWRGVTSEPHSGQRLSPQQWRQRDRDMARRG